jgi:hypothetical protein
MLANASQSRSCRPVFGSSRRGLSVAVVTLSIITGLGISELTARSGIEPSGEIVNRILKGDVRRRPLQSSQMQRAGLVKPIGRSNVRDYRLAANRWLVRWRILNWHASQAVACRRCQSIAANGP